jgi:hypothetical protein
VPRGVNSFKDFGPRARHFLRWPLEDKTMFDSSKASFHAAPFACKLRRSVARAAVHLLTSAVPSLSFATLLACSGCGGGPEAKLEGKWVGDRIDNVSAEQVVRATAWVKATTLEFAGDKLTVAIPGETARKGTFKVAKVEGEKVVLSVHRKDSATRDETVLTMQGDKTLHWDIGQSREITLVRAQ